MKTQYQKAEKRKKQIQIINQLFNVAKEKQLKQMAFVGVIHRISLRIGFLKKKKEE